MGKFNNPVFRFYDFDKIWRYIPATRRQKEILKSILFTLFPYVFKHWAIYQNWKNAKVFKDNHSNFLQGAFWRKRLFNSYRVRIATPGSRPNHEPVKNKLAIAVHAFYPDIFSDLLEQINRNDYQPITLYITTPPECFQEIDSLLKSSNYPYQIFTSNNHGRDILPFLNILPKISDDHQFVLKMHTKKSNHLNRKYLWRDDLYTKLIGPGAIREQLNIFDMNSKIGMIGPSGHILPMSLYYGANGLVVRELCRRIGLKESELSNLNFVAGSMFYARLEAIKPLLDLGLHDYDFEPELGQTDGTLAHSIERVFAACLLKSGYQLADTDYSLKDSYYTVTKNHYFSI